MTAQFFLSQPTKPRSSWRRVSGIALGICIPGTAFAYLDPGSGSMLVYALTGMAATVAYLARGLYYRLTATLWGRADQLTAQLTGIDLVFYSEGGQYWGVFNPVIDALMARGIRCAYLTSDPRDAGLQTESSLVSAFHIGSGARAAALLNNLSADVVVMTTPQLDVFNIKRSKQVRHYSHLIHAPTDTLLYRRYAFDHYDSVMCSGPHQIDSIRALEEHREGKAKLLLETGCTYYDNYETNARPLSAVGSGDQPVVLIAPTWGPNGLLAAQGMELLKPILEAHYEVILRPHPQTYKSEADLMESMEELLAPYANVTIDRNPTAAASMAAASIMVSDLSGVIFDFAFLFKRPVIVIDNWVSRDGYEAEYLDRTIWEIDARERIGRVVSGERCRLLPSIISETLGHHSSKDAEQFRKESVYNFGRAGEVAASQIEEILRSVRDERTHISHAT